MPLKGYTANSGVLSNKLDNSVSRNETDLVVHLMSMQLRNFPYHRCETCHILFTKFMCIHFKQSNFIANKLQRVELYAVSNEVLISSCAIFSFSFLLRYRRF